MHGVRCNVSSKRKDLKGEGLAQVLPDGLSGLFVQNHPCPEIPGETVYRPNENPEQSHRNNDSLKPVFEKRCCSPLLEHHGSKEAREQHESGHPKEMNRHNDALSGGGITLHIPVRIPRIRDNP